MVALYLRLHLAQVTGLAGNPGAGSLAAVSRGLREAEPLRLVRVEPLLAGAKTPASLAGKVPLPGARYRFKKVNRKTSIRVAYRGNKLVETRKFKKVKGRLKPAGPAKRVRRHRRKISVRR